MSAGHAPILEFDPDPRAVIEPSAYYQPIDIPRACVVCFFQDVIDRLLAEGRIRKVKSLRSEIGRHRVYEIEVERPARTCAAPAAEVRGPSEERSARSERAPDGAPEYETRRVALFHPGVGAPLAAALLEGVIAFGCRDFVICGGAGALQSTLAIGHVIVPVSAVRDEGTSYHYLPPAREVEAAPEVTAAVERVLDRRGIAYARGKTWTTDAIFRETRDKVRRRREDGCLTVEMEAAALFAVARFRGARAAAVLYAGDDVGGETHDLRDWTRRAEDRERLFWVAAEACASL